MRQRSANGIPRQPRTRTSSTIRGYHVASVKVLHLFADTNVFLQCKPLEQVDWSSLGDWDRIDLIVTRPVQAEIDALKGKGNGRQASRARLASSQIRKLLETDQGALVLHEQPLVHLSLRHDLRRDESASAELDYEARDDQLVGTVLAFQKCNPDESIRLLTNDTGPMASAKTVGVSYCDIPEEWLLPAESGEAEKREAKLQAEIARYKSLEPSFVIFTDPPGGERLEATSTVFQALTEDERDRLLARLMERFPLCVDFGPKERLERSGPASEAMSALYAMFSNEVFHPATSDEIEKYRTAYKEWKDKCQSVLTKLHSTLQRNLKWPHVSISIENTGSRPADDVLVVLEAQGNVVLMPPEKPSADEPDEVDELRLPPVPVAPKGRWRRAISPIGEDLLAGLRGLDGGWRPEDFLSHALDLQQHARDPNGVYFKSGRRGAISRRVEYECAQWRHAQAAEDFELDVLCRPEPGSHSGLVKIEVHAANLTQPAVAQVPVTVSVEVTSCYEAAQELIDRLLA